jgi:putative ABC transport system permease protein
LRFLLAGLAAAVVVGSSYVAFFGNPLTNSQKTLTYPTSPVTTGTLQVTVAAAGPVTNASSAIQIRNVPFTVIGLLASKGSGAGGNQDDVIMIPFNTGQVRLFGSTSINQIVLQVADASQIPTVTADITTLLTQLHRLSPGQPADFTIQSNNDVISRVSSVTSTLTTLLGGVAAVSLVVGGIGIMNIMLVSVTERTREIGIRLAIGAQPSGVMTQFLIEAVMLSIIGGFIGILIGSGVALAMPYVAGWTTVLPWQAILLAFGVSAVIGMFFGIYPARRASLLDPITALRYE